MKTRILNRIGLILGIFGVFIIFIWGPPQPSFETGVSIGLEDNTPIDRTGKTVVDYNKEVIKRQELYSRMSKIGLGLIGLGFIFQFIATWVDKPCVLQPEQKTNDSHPNPHNDANANNP